MTITITPATEEEVRSGEVGRRLREYNYTHIGEYPQPAYIRLNARDEDGRVVGGLRSVLAMHWLRVEVLWVEDATRRQGVGSRLLGEAERLAQESGARNAALETFEFQAPAFYARHGYEEAGRIDDYAGGFYLLLMKKRLG